MMANGAEQTFGFGPFLLVVVVVVVMLRWCGVVVVLLWSLQGKWQLGPLGLRSGKKKHNFLFYFP